MKLMSLGIIFLCLALALVVVGSLEINKTATKLKSSNLYKSEDSSNLYIGMDSGFVNKTGDYLKRKK